MKIDSWWKSRRAVDRRAPVWPAPRRAKSSMAAALDEYVGRGTFEERLPRMIDAWFTYVERHPYAWRLLFRDTTGDQDVAALHRDLQARQRAADAALLRENLPGLGDEQIEPLAEVVRSSLTGLALWWLDHPAVERRVLVTTMLDVLGAVLAHHRASATSTSP